MKNGIAALLAWIPVCTLWAQVAFQGTVQDQKGAPLPGATIQLMGTRYITSSDIDGNFGWSALQEGTYRLSVSYVGYQTLQKEVVLEADQKLVLELVPTTLVADAVFVYATRAHGNSPMTYTDMNNSEIEDRNLGQDLPVLVGFSPSVVVTSDAGNGVGYTGLRIRGSDPTRVNVTINGVPVNDSESHGVYWVNMPDFASSLQSIQIQRGVGTSTNGAAAFGASMNLQTDMPATMAFGELQNGFGSFNTRRHTLKLGTGLINDHWAFEGRLSQISSDGYIDRANSDLKSYYLSGGYYGKKTIVKALAFAGKEVTYQSWWGTPEARLNNDLAGMQEVIANNGYSDEQARNLLESGRTFNYYQYDNEVDNYQQDHYQLHFTQQLGKNWTAQGAFHYTYGRGYYEQFREDDDLADYGWPDLVIGDSTISSIDLIRRRWLDNHFYGVTASTNYQSGLWDITLGGAWNTYDGDHFGEVIWAQFAGSSRIRDRYYDNVGKKREWNSYAKANYQLTQKLNLYGDIQLRHVDYSTTGIDSDQREIPTSNTYLFFNPKFGITYTLNKQSNIYASMAVGNREPVRTDIIDAPVGTATKHETLYNLEAGFRKQSQQYGLEVNYYLMNYRNQLVLTGALNDVGSSIRVNVPDSYRTGVELSAYIRPISQLTWNANLTLSQNKIQNFTEVIYDYGTNFDEFNVVENNFKDTDISFSPNVIGGSQLTYSPRSWINMSWYSKYVGKQYLDNTSSDARKIDAYWVNDFKVDFELSPKWMDQIDISLMVNNLLDVAYSANGYTFGYAGGAYQVRENYFYPQAGINFMAGLTLKF